MRYVQKQNGGTEWGKIDALVTIAELGETGDLVLIIGGMTDLKKEASTIAEVTVIDVMKGTFFQNQLLSKQRLEKVFAPLMSWSHQRFLRTYNHVIIADNGRRDTA